ncbi:Peroxiredoxin [Mycena kentingensis (nom. inval.)]|nr:Peroxiredoxin [Mycena kentingensis (nom. inval.)]
MPNIAVGDTLPPGIFSLPYFPTALTPSPAVFGYIPWAPELDDNLACGVPSKLNTDSWAGKKVVLISVPGAFTPTCHVNHLPPYLERYQELKAKGVDIIAVLAANDLFVMSGWARSQSFKDKILALSDANAKWSQSLGLSLDLTEKDLGIRTARYAMIIDDLKVKYVEQEPGAGVTVSGVDAILAKL